MRQVPAHMRDPSAVQAQTAAADAESSPVVGEEALPRARDQLLGEGDAPPLAPGDPSREAVPDDCVRAC